MLLKAQLSANMLQAVVRCSPVHWFKIGGESKQHCEHYGIDQQKSNNSLSSRARLLRGSI
jgi:hypothetical protein